MGRFATVSDVLVQCLIAHGIELVFGYPGAAICPFYDSLSKQKKHIKHILVRQEQNACHSASGYARASKKVAVCTATSGPGALNLIPAIATAYMDSVPLVIITGQVSSNLLGRDVFQEADITGAAEPFVKHSYLLRDERHIKEVIDEAFFIASTGRQGPVLIDIPVDVQQKKIDTSLLLDKFTPPRGYKTDYITEDIRLSLAKETACSIKSVKRPLLCVGGGVFGADASCELEELLTKTKLPFVTTMMGLSAVEKGRVNSLGMIGHYGNEVANKALRECDLLFLIGARVGDRAINFYDGLFLNKTIIHLDIDPAEINKNVRTHIGIADDAKRFLPLLLNELDGYVSPSWASCRLEKVQSNTPSELIALIYKSLKPNAIVACDVGQHLLWMARHYSLDSGRFLASGGMGTMGYSLPAAVGAQLAFLKREVVAVCGDGGFQMNMMELATIKSLGLPIKLILMDNHSLGMVKELQHASYDKREFAVCLDGNPDFSKLFSAYGIKSLTLDMNDDIDMKKQTIKAFFAYNSAVALVCKVESSHTSFD